MTLKLTHAQMLSAGNQFPIHAHAASATKAVIPKPTMRAGYASLRTNLSVNQIPRRMAKSREAARRLSVITSPYWGPVNAMTAMLPIAMNKVNIVQVDMMIFFVKSLILVPFCSRLKPDAFLYGGRELT